MNIREMKVTKQHRYMEKNIILNDDINILVGINGSGKTSVLNIISMILEPSIEDLCLLDFEKIELDFDLEETRHKIICTKENENFSFRMFKQDVQFPELSIEKYKNSIPRKIASLIATIFKKFLCYLFLTFYISFMHFFC